LTFAARAARIPGLGGGVSDNDVKAIVAYLCALPPKQGCARCTGTIEHMKRSRMRA